MEVCWGPHANNANRGGVVVVVVVGWGSGEGGAGKGREGKRSKRTGEWGEKWGGGGMQGEERVR